MAIISDEQLKIMREHNEKRMARAEAAMPEVFELMEEQRQYMLEITGLQKDLGEQVGPITQREREAARLGALYEHHKKIMSACADQIVKYLSTDPSTPFILAEKENGTDTELAKQSAKDD